MQIGIQGIEEALLGEVCAIVGDAACVEAEAEAFANSVQAMLAREDESSFWDGTSGAADAGMDIVEEPAAIVAEAAEIVVGAFELQREAEADAAARQTAAEAASSGAAPDAGSGAGFNASPSEPESGASATDAEGTQGQQPAAESRRPAGRRGTKRGGKGSR